MPTVFSAHLLKTIMSMRLNFDPLLLDKMSEGVILLNRQAEILAHNRAATPWLPQGRAMSAVLKALIDREVRGRIVMPQSIGVWRGKTPQGTYPGEAWMILNGRHDYAVFIVPQEQSQAHADAKLMPVQPASLLQKSQAALLGDEARAQMQILRDLLVSLKVQPPPGVQAIVDQAAFVDQLLRETADFARLMQHEQSFVEERLVLSDLLNDLLKNPSRILDRPDVELTFAHSGAQQGPVYGHARWLRYALQVLLERLAEGAPPASQVKIMTRQMGDFLVITGHVVVNPVKDKRPLRAAVIAADAQPQLRRRSATDARVRLLMCQRIVELHNGQLKLEFMPESPIDGTHHQPIESFTMTLTTGLPAQQRHSDACAQCPINLQTQAYAADLVQLLSLNQP